MKKVKQIAAIIGIVLIVSMYLVTLFSAIFTTQYTKGLFQASLFATFVVPVMLYAFMLVYKLVNKKDNTVYLDKLKDIGNDNSTNKK